MPGRPNILLIVCDDLGYGDLGAFENPEVDTPSLDALAAEGLRLTQHYAGSAVCAPSRAALMSGRYPHRTGAIDTLEGRGLDRLALRERTIADCFAAAGYATGLVGKWHLGALDPRYHPMRRGFAETCCFRGGWQDYYQWRLDYNGQLEAADGRYLTDVFSDETVAFINRHADEPFFLHVTYNAPHTPLQVPDRDADRFRATGRLQEGVCRLYGMNRRVDEGVGRMLEALDRRGLTENTLVLFTSDNGPQFGSELGPRSLERYNGLFHGSKGSVYEGGIRVPAIVRWPAGLPQGQVDELVHFTDWLPTLTGLVDAPQPELPLDGRGVLPVLRGETAEAPPPRFWQWNRYTPEVTSNAAMRDDDWKLVRPAIRESMVVSEEDLAMDHGLKYEPDQYDDIRRDPEPERTLSAPAAPLLYHLSEDPYEQIDRAADEPDRLRRMLGELETWFESVEADRRSIDDGRA